MMQTAAERLRAHWFSHGLRVGNGCGEEEIIAFETANDIRFPIDLRYYLLKINGMYEEWPHDMDKNGFSFWPLSKLKSLPEESKLHNFGSSFLFAGCESLFLFADYLQWSWAYAIHLTKVATEYNHVTLISGSGSTSEVAYTFSEFVELYITDSPKLYAGLVS